MAALRWYVVDAFVLPERPFSGNPAAVVPLQEWVPDATLQAMAAQHNLSETAFVKREGEGSRLRWFTPATEVPLCGHATLAASLVLERGSMHGERSCCPFEAARHDCGARGTGL